MSVSLAQHDFFQSCTFCGKDFLLDAANREHLSSEGDFTAHREEFSDFSLGEGTGQCRQHGDPSTWPILGNGALRNVDVDIPFVKDFRRESQPVRVCLQVLKCDDGRFLHDITQIAGQRELASTRRQGRLDEQNVATSWGPSQTCDDTSHIVPFVVVPLTRNAKDVS